MHQPPAKVDKQSFESTIADFESQRKRLDQSIAWMKNVGEGLKQIRSRGLVEFTNTTPIMQSSRTVEIALQLPTANGPQDIAVFTIVCAYTKEELAKMMADPMVSLEALQQATNQRWLETYKVRPFDVWSVQDKLIWKGDDAVTGAWLSAQVKEWIGYWFFPMKVSFRIRKNLFIEKTT